MRIRDLPKPPTTDRLAARRAGAVESALAGQTPWRDAFRMPGLSKTQAIHTIDREVGVML
jgi:hypothetical protein